MNENRIQPRTLWDLDALDGYITFPEAAEDLDLTGERIRQMAVEGKLRTALRIGRRPLGIVKESEIIELLAARNRKAEDRERSAGRL